MIVLPFLKINYIEINHRISCLNLKSSDADGRRFFANWSQRRKDTESQGHKVSKLEVLISQVFRFSVSQV